MKIWTKAERESVRMQISISYNMGKVKMHVLPLVINPAKLSTRDFNALVGILERYGTNSKRKKPLMQIIK